MNENEPMERIEGRLQQLHEQIEPADGRTALPEHGGTRIETGVGVDRIGQADGEGFAADAAEPASPEHGEKPKELWPRIYVASLSDYNAGRLHGAWIEAGQDSDSLGMEITAMLERSKEPNAEEWAIHDFEEFGPVRLSEYESLERISAVAQGLEKHGKAFGYWANYVGTDLDKLQSFEQAYLGHWESMTAYGEQGPVRKVEDADHAVDER